MVRLALEVCNALALSTWQGQGPGHAAGSFMMRKAVMGLSTAERPPDSPFYTTAEVATILRCSTRTVQNHIKQGRLPAAIVGRNRYRVPKKAVDALIQPIEEAQTPCDGTSADP